jgi:adenylate cyclase
LREAVAAYDRDEHRFLEQGFATDSGISAHCWLIWAEWLAGRPVAAAAAAQRANDLAEQLGNPYTRTFARAWMAVGGVLARDPDRALRHGEETIAMASESGFPLMEAIGGFAKYSAEAMRGDPLGVDRYRAAMGAAASAGNRSSAPLIFATLADCQLTHGHYDDALGSVEAGLVMAAETGQPFYDAELHRIAGEAHYALHPGGGPIAAGEAAYTEALRIARDQGAHALELRIAVSLARAWKRSGREQAARELLVSAIAWIEGGTSPPDLLDARAVLDSLA